MGGVIRRDPKGFQEDAYDLVVVGGGIYGVAATLTAARAGRRVLLLEREDFGGATSWNNLRVLHGGLRYLQTLDLRRFRKSVRARSWYLEEFPDLIEPLPCLMPLYGRGLRRRATLGPALALNERLRRRWSSEAELAMLPEGHLLSEEEVVERFGAVRRTGLRGGALWFDGLLVRPQRVLIEMLRRATALGARALNHMEMTDWVVREGRIVAVQARDSLKWHEYEFRTSDVLNCAGPWAAALAAQDDPGLAEGFHPSLAFNLLLDHPLDSTVSVAVEPAEGGRTYFLHPRGDRTLAGTYHAATDEGDARPSPEQVDAFLADLRAAVPDFYVTDEHVLRVMSGVLPARRPRTAELSTRPILRTDADHDGPGGLHSLIGVKYTTAPLAAEAAVRRIFDLNGPIGSGGRDFPPVREIPDSTAFGLWADREPEAAGVLLEALVAEESVVEADDLLLRRTDWGLDPRERNRTEARIRQLRPQLFDRQR